LTANMASASLLDIVGDHPDSTLFECKASATDTLDLVIKMTEVAPGTMNLQIDYRSRQGVIQQTKIENARKSSFNMHYVLRGDPALQKRDISEQYEVLFQFDTAMRIQKISLRPVEANLEGTAGFECEI
jgi:hypothetical protein